jgi:hypothetical protein
VALLRECGAGKRTFDLCTHCTVLRALERKVVARERAERARTILEVAARGGLGMHRLRRSQNEESEERTAARERMKAGSSHALPRDSNRRDDRCGRRASAGRRADR